jgi:AcrR family transcriptional regulator
MRLLGERLGTSTATLYRHVANKDELMVYVVDRVFADVADAAPDDARPPATWQEAVIRGSVDVHRVLQRHPNLLPLLVSQVPIGPHGLANRERSIALLMHYGFSPHLAARAFTTLAHYVVGFAIQQHAPGAPGPDDAHALAEYYRGLDPEVYPATVAAADALTEVPLEEEFLEGLHFVVDGIDRARRRERRQGG